MAISDRKYSVYKQIDGSCRSERIPPQDVFVLRGKDILALGALRSYLDKILFTLELDAGEMVQLDDDTRKHLHELADYVHEKAEIWERAQAAARLPD